MKRILVLAFIASAVGSQAAGFTAGNLVVSVAGDGTAAVSSAGTAIVLKEFTTTGSLVNTYALPTTTAGGNNNIVCSGTATSELQLTKSSNGKYLLLGGYDATVGTTSIAATTNNRVVARIAADGTIDTSTSMSGTYSNTNIRSVVSVDGTSFWMTGSSGSTGGVRYATYGSNSSTQLSSTITNTRVAGIYNGQLYISSASSPFYGVATVGSGLPTTSGNTITLLSGFPTTSGPSTYDFEFVNDNTLFVADDRASLSGGLQKWTLSGGTWTLATTYNLSNGSSGYYGLRSLAYDSVNSTFYAVSTGNSLVSFTEAGGFTTLATGTSSSTFRGVEFAPTSEAVPEPASMVALGFGALALISRRRRNR